MKLTVRGKKEELSGDSFTIPELLVALEVESPDMVTVEVNDEIIEKARYTVFRVKDGDSVDFLYFMGGGSRG